jgi:DNA processing protein
MSLRSRQVLFALSLHFEGDYEKMFDEIAHKRRCLGNDEIEELSRTKMDCDYCVITEENYPDSFKQCMKPPLIFYYYGNLSLLKSKHRITCVGTRAPNLYQTETCYRMIQEMEDKLDNQVVVVSGMAKGLDQTFMKGAMDKGAPVVSIVGAGIDEPYPKENDGIYDYCKSGKGLILSEYPLKTKAKPENFLFRNRLLAAASDVLFIGGAKKRSGTSSTLSYALEFGKNVCALPCNISGDDLTNQIIKDGADLILDADDLVREVSEASK